MSEFSDSYSRPRLRGVKALFSLVTLGTLLVMVALPLLSTRAAEPANPAFGKTWERPDYPVASGQANRTWMWGPKAFTPGLTETYAEAPGGERTVQYYDKSRMEITDPNGDPTSDWYVTNGLLVVELVSGKMQTGDNRFETRNPATVNVAGDDDDPTGPTYRTFSYVLDEPARDEGDLITQRIDRSGKVTSDSSLVDYGVTASRYVPTTGHTVAAPFWQFMNSSGTVYRDGQYITDTLFPSAYYATGLPIAEAYWAEVKVGGEYKDVLMQCFERRCLTYTPENPSGWQVEAGNVGLHYYAWRYGDETPSPDPDPSPTPDPDPDPSDDYDYQYGKNLGERVNPLNELKAPHGVAVTPQGNVVVIDDAKHRVQIYGPNGSWVGAFGGDSGYGSFDHKDAEVDKNGTIWILDTKNHKIVGFDESGRKRGEIGGPGSSNGQLNSPEAFTIGPDGYFYVADAGNTRVQVFDANGHYVRGWGESGSGDGQFLAPTGIAVDLEGNVFVADGRAHRVQMFDATGKYRTKWGARGSGEIEFDGPSRMAIDKNGALYIVDQGNNRVQVFTTDGEPIRRFGTGGSAPGQFSVPADIATDEKGYVYVADLKNGRVQKLTGGGEFQDSWKDDSRSRFAKPAGADLSDDGYLYVVDTDNRHVKVFDERGNFVGAIYGKFDYPVDVAVGAEYLYVLDAGLERIVVFTLESKPYAVWGSPGNGPGKLDEPTSIDVDDEGNVYVVNEGNSTIQKFDEDGDYVREIGQEGNGPGEYIGPLGITVYGNYVYVTDNETDRVLVFNLDGEFVREWGGPGDEPGYFDEPTAIDVDIYGNVYVIDEGNTRIQKLTSYGEHLATISPANSGGPSFIRPVGITVGDGDEVYVVTDTEALVLIYRAAS